MPKKKGKKLPTTPLEAVEAGDLARLQELIHDGMDVNQSEEYTALSQAAEMGRADMVRALLQAGADPSFGGICVPLCRAVCSEKVEVVRLLLDAKADVDTQEEDGSTALMQAAGMGDLEMVKMLVAAGADPKVQDEDVQWGGLAKPCPHCGTVFAAVVRERECPQCRRRFKAQEAFGSNLNDLPLFVSWSNRFVPLMAAARVGDATIAALLIDAGADVNRGKEGITPLMTACYFGHADVARVLMERGADVKREAKTPDRLKQKRSAVGIAAGRHNVELVKLLWEAGAPAKDKKPTLLVDAARRGDVPLIRRLIAEGADPSKEDPLTREDALSVGAKVGQSEAAKALIEAGAPVNPPSARQMTALLLAVDAFAEKCKRGRIPPEDVNRYLTTAQCLIDAGASVDVSFFGFKPLDRAKEAKCQPLIELLESATRRERDAKKKH
jgi:uncharacterized protein